MRALDQYGSEYMTETKTTAANERNIEEVTAEVEFDTATWIAKYGKSKRIPGTWDEGRGVLITRRPDDSRLSNNGGDYLHAFRETEDGVEYNLMYGSEFSEWRGGYEGEIRPVNGD